MHLSSAIHAILAASAIVSALPEPGLDIQISIKDPSIFGDIPLSSAHAHGASISAEDRVHYVQSAAEYDTLKHSYQNLVVVEFTAEWCGPCRAMAASFSALSNTYESAIFVAVDIDNDALSNLPDVGHVRAVPHFKFFKLGGLITEFSGAGSEKLEKAIKENL